MKPGEEFKMTAEFEEWWEKEKPHQISSGNQLTCIIESFKEISERAWKAGYKDGEEKGFKDGQHSHRED